MLLSDNTYKVLNLLENFNNLNNIDKVRLTVNILENINFRVDYPKLKFEPHHKGAAFLI